MIKFNALIYVLAVKCWLQQFIRIFCHQKNRSMNYPICLGWQVANTLFYLWNSVGFPIFNPLYPLLTLPCLVCRKLHFLECWLQIIVKQLIKFHINRGYVAVSLHTHPHRTNSPTSESRLNVSPVLVTWDIFYVSFNIYVVLPACCNCSH